ncbi:MAG: hypothetical protein WAO58_10560 [Fimbriimonadaceae bacterium]
MTRTDFELSLLFGIGLCALMAVIALLRTGSKGLSAWFQAGGYFALGGTLMLIRNDAALPLVIAGFIVVGLMLAADIVFRSVRDRKEDAP